MDPFKRFVRDKVIESISEATCDIEDAVKNSLKLLTEQGTILRWYIRYNSNKTEMESITFTSSMDFDYTISFDNIDIKYLVRERKINNLLDGNSENT